MHKCTEKRRAAVSFELRRTTNWLASVRSSAASSAASPHGKTERKMSPLKVASMTGKVKCWNPPR